MPRTNRSPFHVLLVEDNPVDARFIRQAFEESGLATRLALVPDGAEALDYLRQRGAHEDASRPDLVVLDLHLPKKDGREVLADVKSDPDLCTIPVTVLTTSDREEDVAEAYRLHANCYITKPFEFSRLSEVVRAIEQFWLGLAELPVA
jgi:CheY-like chemotaxis protein